MSELETVEQSPVQGHEDPSASRYSCGKLIVRNEFGVVSVEVCGPQGRERLKIADLRTSAAVELDPLELESLAWASHRDLATLLDPGRTRWRPEHDDD